MAALLLPIAAAAQDAELAEAEKLIRSGDYKAA